MSTVSQTSNIGIKGFASLDSEMEASLEEDCLHVDQVRKNDRDAESSTHLNNAQMETPASIKMEFSCSPERVCEPIMDYFLEDVVEICSISDSADEASEDGITSIINTKAAQAVSDKNKMPEQERDDDDENMQLSFVMNDHNYSSQTDSPTSSPNKYAVKDGNNLRSAGGEIDGNSKSLMKSETVVNCMENSSDEAERKEIEEYMEMIIKENGRKTIKPKIESGIEDSVGNDALTNDPELFLQNVMDEITAEDAADEAAEEAHRSPTKDNESKASDSSNNEIAEDDGDETETCSFQSTCDERENDESTKKSNAIEKTVEKSAEKTDQKSITEEDKQENQSVSQLKSASENVSQTQSSITVGTSIGCSSVTTGADDEDTETICSRIYNLTENPSERMEKIDDFEDGFEQFDLCMPDSQESTLENPLLTELTILANEMNIAVKQFAAASTDISDRLRSYIVEKTSKMKALANQCNNVFMTDKEQQTEAELESKRLRKLNKRDKRDLLAATDSSTSTSSVSSSSSSSDEQAKKRTKKFKHKRPRSAEGVKISADEIADEVSTESPAIEAKVQTQQSNFSNIDAIYDDGVNLSKYLCSDIFSAVTQKTTKDYLTSSASSAAESSSAEDSTDDGSKAKARKSKSKLATSQGGRKSKHRTDEDDREIERLINLDGLLKRPVNASSTKTSEVDKSKTKSIKQKTDEMLEFLERDLAKDSLSSDESVNENENEVITEKQYLERYNADLKRQLLDDSSDDTSADEDVDNEFAPVLSDDGSDSGNRSPLVDKFLKTFNVEDSEDENSPSTPIPEAAKELATKDQEKPAATESHDAENSKVDQVKEESKENIATNASDNSDCELLNDNFIYRKRTQPKTLEKILSEAEKRKKIQKLDEDLISLSSESEESDSVEAVEPAEVKSRSIKPMLKPEQLQRETLKAQKGETERIRRLDKRQAMLARILKEHPDMNKDSELVLDYIEDTKTFVKVHPDLVKLLKPHQRDGVRFMYDSVYGGVDAVKKNHGSGCILAHCMGLGKTLQLIALMHTVVSYKELKTRKILVLCPKSTVMNWGDEIIRWLYPLATKNLKVFTFSDTSDINEKLEIMKEWSSSKRAGCLLVGYEAFRTLVFYHTYRMRHNLDAKRLDQIRDAISNYLLEPGADLVVCDEGHIIKNSKSAISLAVAEIKTAKRIVLTGTPIQNNLKEYYSMVNFIKPLFLGTEKEFANMYANPIKNGQHKDSSKKDIKVMKQRSFVLHKKLSKFVQRKEAELLKTFLPKKFEYVLFVPMTEVQNKLYERILEDIASRSDSRGRSLITDYTCLRKIWTHPKVLEDAWKNAVNLSYKRNAKNNPAHSDDDQPDDIYDSQVGFMSVKNDWWRNLIAEKDLESILPSNKLRTMFEILRMCEENGDKCLIFSAFVAVLNVVEYFFRKLTSGDKETMSELNLPPGVRSVWEPNKDYFRLDGKTAKSTRHEMIKRFNHPQTTRARVFLISAKAGGQGINLIGANRVIILDTSWNPSNDQQNIFRVFRLGQKKNCYIYRLLAMGTMEEKVYSRSVTKQAMSYRVVDVQQIDRHYSMAELAELYTLTVPKFSERPTPVLPQDNILANLLRSFPDLVYKYHEHDSLLENKVEQELSEQDKIDAWDAYERDLQMNSQLTQMPNMEDLQMRLSQGQMANYMPSGMGGPMAGLDFQSLLNFRSGLGQAPTNASFLNPLLQQYNNLSNQQYLEILQSLRQYTSGGVGDKSPYSAAAASAYANMYGGVVPAVSPHHTSGGSITPGVAAASSSLHPLNALNDLSMFGLGGSNPAAASNPANLYASAAAPNMPSTGVSSAANLYANSAASYYDQYMQKYGAYAGAGGGGGIGMGGGNVAAQSSNNLLSSAAAAASALSSFANSTAFQTPRRTPPTQTAGRKSSTPDLLGYRTSGGNNSASLGTTATTTAPSLAASLANFMPPTANSSGKPTSDYGSLSSNKNYHRTTSTPNAQQQQLNQTPIPTSIFAATSNALATAAAAASIYSSSKAISRPNTSTTQSAAAAAALAKTTDAQIRVKDMGQLVGTNSSRANSLQATMNAAAAAKDVPQAKNKNNDSNSNMNSSSSSNNNYSGSNSRQRQMQTKSASAADMLKARSEMQIIPTTNPPGTASISKQLSEMSPSISLTAVHSSTANNTKSQRTNNNNNSNNNTKNNNINANAATPTATTNPTTVAQRQAQQSAQQQAKKLHASSPNATVSSNKAATLTRLTTNTSDGNKKLLSNTSATNSTTASTVATAPANNIAVNKKANQPNQSSPTVAPVASQKQLGTASILRQQQFRKMPPPVPVPPVGTSTVLYPSTVPASNKTATQKSAGNAANPSTSAKLAFNNNSKKATIERQSPTITAATTTAATTTTKSALNAQVPSVAKLITNSASKQQNAAINRERQSPTTIRMSTSTLRTASPTGATIVRKPATVNSTSSSSGGLQISAVSNTAKFKPSTTSLAASITTKIPSATTTAPVPIQMLRSNSALSSTANRYSSLALATSATTRATTAPLTVASSTATTKTIANNAAIRSNQATATMITPKIASVTSLSRPTTSAAPKLATASLKRSATSVQLNPQSLKLLQEKRFATTSTPGANATAVANAKAAAAATLLQQKQRLSNAGSTLAQTSPANQQTARAAIQRSVSVRPIQKPNSSDNSASTQAVQIRSGASNLQGITKFILDRKRKPDANSKESGILNKRAKES